MFDTAEAADEAIFLTEVRWEGDGDFGTHFGDDLAGWPSAVEEVDDRAATVEAGGDGGDSPLVELRQTDGAFEMAVPGGLSLHLRCCTHDVYGSQTTASQVFDSILNLDKLSKVNVRIFGYKVIQIEGLVLLMLRKVLLSDAKGGRMRVHEKLNR